MQDHSAPSWGQQKEIQGRERGCLMKLHGQLVGNSHGSNGRVIPLGLLCA